MGIISPILYALLGFGAYALIAPRFRVEEQRWLRLSLAMHVVMAFANVFLTVKLLGGGDMLWYHRAGSELADLWRTDPAGWTPELMKLTLRMEAKFPFWVHGAAGDNSTGSMFGISAWLMVFSGNSLYGACVILSILNFFSRLAIYSVFRRLIQGPPLTGILWAVMLFPSAVFWTGGLLKESVAMAGLGYAIYGAYRLAERGDFARGAALILVGGFTSYLVKPYVLFPVLLATPLWYVAARLKRDSDGIAVLLTPFRVVVAIVLAVTGLALLGRFVPALAVDNVADELMAAQASWDRVSASSAAYSLMDAEARQRGVVSQLLYAPLALIFALTRPWLFEARSPQMLVAAVETTALMALSFLAFRRLKPTGVIRAILDQPVMLFCFGYVLVFGTAIGLGTGNIGSLSRYRVPMLAAYGALVAYVYMYQGTAAAEAASGAPPSVARTGRRRRALKVRNRAPRPHIGADA